MSEPPGGAGNMQIAGCPSRSLSLVVSAKKTIKQDEVTVSILVRVPDTIKQD